MSPNKPTLAAASSPAAASQALAIVAAGINMDPDFMYSSDCNAHLTVRIRDALSTVDGADVLHDINAAFSTWHL